MKLLKSATIYLSFLISFVFSNSPYNHSLEFSLPIYRFSYSEELNKPSYGRDVWIFGQPRSDEYGSTAGGEIGYKYFDRNSKLSFGVKFNYSRSINHTYDGSLQGEVYVVYPVTDDNRISEEGYPAIIYEPVMIKDKNNYFYGADIEIGYLISANYSRVIFEPKVTATINGWMRPVGYTEYYYWSRICPGISLTTQNSQKLGVFSDLSLSIPVWQEMILRWGSQKYKFDIGGKIGWQFEFGFLRYLQRNRTFKITYFYECYGFKQSGFVNIPALGGPALEPSSDTNNHGVKISLEFGFGGE